MVICKVAKKNDVIALVGGNGSGKTTIIKLLLRFYDPTSGIITINGIDIKKYDVNEYRKIFSTMFQDYINYAFTVRENIILSKIDTIEDGTQLIDACNRSGLDIFLEKTPDGLEQYISRQFVEEGIELSGGEYQRLAIARTFYRNSPFVILDEPSASLDPLIEHQIFETLSELFKGKGSVIISHRLSNVMYANKIIVLKEGEIVEEGTHNELIETDKLYKKMYKLQAEKYDCNNL